MHMDASMSMDMQTGIAHLPLLVPLLVVNCAFEDKLLEIMAGSDIEGSWVIWRKEEIWAPHSI